MKAKNHSRGWRLPLALLALLAFPGPGRCQHEAPPPPAAYALKNATVHHVDGREETGVNILVRGGLIQALGPGVAVPPDALILEGDSLHVFPGMVDADGEAQLEVPEVGDGDGSLPWNPSREQQGFTPHRLAADYLTGEGADGRPCRIAGILAAGIHPPGGMAPGQSLAVIYRKNARSPRDLVAQPRAGLHFTFQGAQGVYPGTLFAVMAHFRQTFEDAARAGLIRAEYAESSQGLTRPRWDPDYEVLREAAAGRVPVFFRASTAGDIRRVLDLSSEIGFRPVIVGGEEAWKVADRLKTAGIPVLVSVDFPQPREWDPPEESPGAGTGETEVAGGERAPEPEPLEPAAAREKERLENAYANAGRLVRAGIPVALTSGGGGGDLREGVRRAVEYGLSEVDAFRGVTVVPATILDIPDFVSLGEGMAANFIVTDGSLFGEETRVRYAFVEGEMEKDREGGIR